VDLRSYIRDIPDFPQPGITFRDITPLLKDPGALNYVVEQMADEARARDAEAIVGIESRGFIFGCPVALQLGLPFVPVRKPGKLPAKRMSVEYSLEYGDSQLDIHEDALEGTSRAFIIDDLLATGGTALATAKLVELIGGEVAGMAFVVELTALQGREALHSYQAASLLRY
jgi:adenine phosphoribosyltransferase